MGNHSNMKIVEFQDLNFVMLRNKADHLLNGLIFR